MGVINGRDKVHTFFQWLPILLPSTSHTPSRFSMSSSSEPQISTCEATVLLGREALNDSRLVRYGSRHSLDVHAPIYFDSDRAQLLKASADSLMTAYDHSHLVAPLEEAIVVYEKALELLPPAHEARADFAHDLGNALYHFCYLHGDDKTRSARCIMLLREALRLRPPGHPLRGQSLHNLARALRSVAYEQLLGGACVLAECVSLNQEALKLRPLGHPDRGKSLINLAAALAVSFENSGDFSLLEEAIEMQREVIPLYPPGHEMRHHALNNLGIALFYSFELRGGISTLAEAIHLLRECLGLRPTGHPLRHAGLLNLASALRLNFLHRGSLESQSEAILLGREALALCPDGNPMRYGCLSGLAKSLLDSLSQTDDVQTLDEAVRLLREALSSQNSGHGSNEIVETLSRLGLALQAVYDQRHDIEALKEAKARQREALQACPQSHHRRIGILGDLARLHCKPGCQSWTEALTLYREALNACPAGYPTRAMLLSGMSICFLVPESPFFNLIEGISHLDVAYADRFSPIHQRLQCAVTDLRLVEDAYREAVKDADAFTTTHTRLQVLRLYNQVIGLLPLAANFGLNYHARLRAVAGSDELVRNAAARAILLGHISQAVGMLEEGRGVFWTQTLHLRATDFDQVPQTERQELERIFRLLNHGASSLESFDRTTLQQERTLQELWELNEEAEALIVQIRSYDGLGRFLMPATFDGLLSKLPAGFIVIVNISKLGCHALLLNSASGLAATLELEPPHKDFDLNAMRGKLPRDIAPRAEKDWPSESRTMRLNRRPVQDPLHSVLALLWTSIAQPVLSKLEIEVSHA
jgi:tetratricopeptide (TPR) repeat protein